MPTEFTYTKAGVHAATLHEEIDDDPTLSAVTACKSVEAGYGGVATNVRVTLTVSINDPSAEKTALDALVTDHAGQPDMATVEVTSDVDVATPVDATPTSIPDLRIPLTSGKWRLTAVCGITTDDTIYWALHVDGVMDRTTLGTFRPPVAVVQQQETFTVITNVDIPLKVTSVVDIKWWSDNPITPTARPRRMTAELRT